MIDMVTVIQLDEASIPATVSSHDDWVTVSSRTDAVAASWLKLEIGQGSTEDV